MKTLDTRADSSTDINRARLVPRKSAKPRWIKRAFAIHRSLMWVSVVGLLLFVVSALMHPLMVWTGPQAVQFRPPSFALDQQQAQQQLARGLEKMSALDKRDIQVAKLVPTEQGAMLQVSRNEDAPRQYYSLSEEQASYTDEQQALWLAQYYTGETRDVDSLLFVDAFSTEYPSVNRLLPVYKVVYEGDDNLSVFVHTETNALAGINNDWKRGLQTLFQWLHTGSWLDGLPELRVLLMAALMISLLLMSVAGVLLLTLFRRRVSPRKSTALHRAFAWVVCLPLMALSFSGLYHLLQGALVEEIEPIRLLSTQAVIAREGSSASVIAPRDGQTAPRLDVSPLVDSLDGRAINSLSLLRFAMGTDSDVDSDWILRASMAQPSARSGNGSDHTDHFHKSERNQRFDGRSSESGAQFFTLDGDVITSLTDQKVVARLARQWLALPETSESEQSSDEKPKDLTLSLVTRFGSDYDFRNKRLPVWRVEAQNRTQDLLFIDPVSGLLVDHQRPQGQWERWSFSNLHKWNPLVPFIGREGRDGVVVFMLCLIGLTGWLGYRMRSSRR